MRFKRSSAGNTRGLIEAFAAEANMWSRASLPRGIPAASLKLLHDRPHQRPLGVSSAGNTRGLIEARRAGTQAMRGRGSSAGNTRGLIEAQRLRVEPVAPGSASSAGNTRGLIEAAPQGRSAATRRVFRGEYPRPH